MTPSSGPVSWRTALWEWQVRPKTLRGTWYLMSKGTDRQTDPAHQGSTIHGKIESGIKKAIRWSKGWSKRKFFEFFVTVWFIIVYLCTVSGCTMAQARCKKTPNANENITSKLRNKAQTRFWRIFSSNSAKCCVILLEKHIVCVCQALCMLLVNHYAKPSVRLPPLANPFQAYIWDIYTLHPEAFKVTNKAKKDSIIRILLYSSLFCGPFFSP